MNRKVLLKRFAMIVAFGLGIVTATPALHGQTKPVDLDVPYVPTHQRAVDAMLDLAKVASTDYVMDLGCGDGRIVVTAAKKFKAKGYGVDLDPQRIKESKENATKAGVNDLVKFELKDIMVTEIREASVVTLFLLNSVNLQLRPRLFSQLKPGTRVVSNTFHMADWKPDQDVRHGKAYEGVIHLWIIPAPAGGVWQAKVKTSAGEVATTVRLDQQFQVVTGAARVGEAAEVPIAEASLKGKQLKFTATPKIGDNEVKIEFEATVEGETMTGTQKWLSGPSAGAYPWTASRSPADVTGSWQVTAPQHAGHNGTLTIASKDGGLTATYLRDGEGQKEKTLKALYVWGPSIRFEVPMSEDRSLIFTGSLAADAGGGSVSAGIEGAKTAWTAKRAAGK